jgi:hypothetical protein
MKHWVLVFSLAFAAACGDPADVLTTPGAFEPAPDLRTLGPDRAATGSHTFEIEAGPTLAEELAQITGAWVDASEALLDRPVRATDGQLLTAGIVFNPGQPSGQTVWTAGRTDGLRGQKPSVLAAPPFKMLGLGKPIGDRSFGFRPLLLGDAQGRPVEIFLYQVVKGAREKTLLLYRCPAIDEVEVCLSYLGGDAPVRHVLRPLPLP